MMLCIKRDVRHKIHQVDLHRKQTDSHKVRSKCPPLAQIKCASMLAIGQLHRQSATAPSHATHAADTVAAHRCHKLWFNTHIAE